MISIYSDPHIGLNLASNTTNDSRKRLRSFIQENVNKIVDSFDPKAYKICSGDFFHTYQNTEEVLYASMSAASKTGRIIAGNHDVVNIADRKGTMDILEAVFYQQIVPCKFGEVSYETLGVTNAEDVVFLVPHHSSQALFEKALSTAKTSAMGRECKKILVTHCNYDSPFVKDDVMLNMTSGMAKDLLEVFDWIVLGHDHNHPIGHGTHEKHEKIKALSRNISVFFRGFRGH